MHLFTKSFVLCMYNRYYVIFFMCLIGIMIDPCVDRGSSCKGIYIFGHVSVRIIAILKYPIP